MSILIKGMEMPQGNSTINVLIYADGTVYTGHVNDSKYSAVSVPTPHGRLIDKDKLRHELFTNFNGERIPFYDCDNFPTTITYRDLHSILSEQKTIIEAEGSEA